MEVLSLRDSDVAVWSLTTYFSQQFGAYSTSKSMVISPSDVSRSTDMKCMHQPLECGATQCVWLLCCEYTREASVNPSFQPDD